MTKRLFRSRNNRVFAGVAGGIAEYFEIDPVIVRALFVISTIGWGAGILVYIVLMIIVPQRQLETIGMSPEGKPIGKEIFDDAENFISELNDKNERSKRKNVFGIALIAIGVLMLLDNLLPTLYFADWWPLVLVAVGVYLLSGTIFKKAE